MTISLIPPEQREGRRTAVLWVAAVGASLLAAAAALFVAVRWNDISPVGKLSIIVCVTAVFLVAGETLRKTLPATGNVLFHLGALLIPVDVGALNLHLGMSWQELLLVEGIVCSVFFGGLAYIGRSKLLSAAAALGIVATAFGIGATTSVPAPVVLAAAAFAYSCVRPRSRAAQALAFTAGAMPILVLALTTGDLAPPTLLDLGLAAAAEPAYAVVTGLLAAFVLGRAAHLMKDVSLAGLAITALAANGATAWIASSLPSGADVVGPAAAFVVLQAVALAAMRDPFWGRIGRAIVNGAEIVAAIVTAQLVAYIATAPFVETGVFGDTATAPNRVLGGAFFMLGLGWVVSMLRHHLESDDPMLWRLGAIAAGVAAIAGVQAGTASASAIAVTMVIAAAGLIAARHPLTDAAAALALFYAPLTAHDHPLTAVLAAVGGAALLTVAARFAATDGRSLRPTWLTIVAVSKLAMAAAFAGSLIDGRADAAHLRPRLPDRRRRPRRCGPSCGVRRPGRVDRRPASRPREWNGRREAAHRRAAARPARRRRGAAIGQADRVRSDRTAPVRRREHRARLGPRHRGHRLRALRGRHRVGRTVAWSFRTTGAVPSRRPRVPASASACCCPAATP